jgi:Lar family restriction alleviation protein
MAKKLKPCPFCGGEATLCCSNDGKTFYAGCFNNGCCDNRYFGSAEEAIEKWNTRPQKKSRSLKPCPFCGGKANVGRFDVDTDYPYLVCCSSCLCQLFSFKKRIEAVKMWNGRDEI